jgi:prepilin-type processing-associated H-X9-DG protein
MTAPNPGHVNREIIGGGNGGFDAPGMYGPSSDHPGGANVGMCGGSVRFLKSTTSPLSVLGVASRARGECDLGRRLLTGDSADPARPDTTRACARHQRPYALYAETSTFIAKGFLCDCEFRIGVNNHFDVCSAHQDGVET